MNKSLLKKGASICAILLSLINFNSAQAAFPDDLNSGVVFIEPGSVGSFISGFAETATLDASISGGSVILNYNKKNSWPAASGQIGGTNLNCCNANAWAFIKVGEKWYGGTWEFLRVGQTVKQLSALRGPSHLKFSPLGGYQARNGDVIGLMVAGITRGSTSYNNVRERSNIVFFRVGGGVVSPEELGFGASQDPEGKKTIITPVLDLLIN